MDLDDDLIPLSALQHYLYCPRQCALIHIEQQWAENRHTVEGQILHQRVDASTVEKRKGVRTVTAMPLVAPELGIAGVADVVEFQQTSDGECAYPIEYKRGRPKAHRADEVQLCAQALCLEAMLGTPVIEGALFYGQTRRREVVHFDATLRTLTIEIVSATRDLFVGRVTPSADYQPRRCDACSLIDICLPQRLARHQSVVTWLQQQLSE